MQARTNQATLRVVHTVYPSHLQCGVTNSGAGPMAKRDLLSDLIAIKQRSGIRGGRIPDWVDLQSERCVGKVVRPQGADRSLIACTLGYVD